MIKIIKINICRFRSIIDLTVDIEQEYGLISICGKNNVGKTNTLRALSLFLMKMIMNHLLICRF